MGSSVLTLREASELLRIHRTTLVVYAERGEIPARRVGRRWLFGADALHQWLEGRTCENRGGNHERS